MEVIEEHQQRNVALKTVPVILKHGRKRLLVNCFLDEGSDTSYVNEDVAEELGFHGAKEPVTISVANDQRVSMMSATFEIGLECRRYFGCRNHSEDIEQDLWRDETHWLGTRQAQFEPFEEHSFPAASQGRNYRCFVGIGSLSPAIPDERSMRQRWWTQRQTVPFGVDCQQIPTPEMISRWNHLFPRKSPSVARTWRLACSPVETALLPYNLWK